MMTVAVVRPAPDGIARMALPAAEAFTVCFRKRGWKVEQVSEPIVGTPDLVAGYGWREVMADAWEKWPERVLHVDGAFFGRFSHMKLALGGRWSPLSGREHDGGRLARHNVKIAPTRPPGGVVLVCGMSSKAAKSWGLLPEQWEREAADRLVAAGALVIYRPKPRWTDATRIPRAQFQDSSRKSLQTALTEVDAVATHHSNAAIDALAAGLPIYTETGIAKALSVERLEDLVGAEAPDLETRTRFMREVAWHEWTLDELASGAWLKPPAPLADHPIFGGA